MRVPASSNRQPWAGRRRSLRRHGLPWGVALTLLRWAGRGVLRAGKALAESYISRKRSNAVAGERLAEAMMRYAELCMSARRTPKDLEEAVTFLDNAAALYTEIGQPEKAAEAQALKAEAGPGDDGRRQ